MKLNVLRFTSIWVALDSSCQVLSQLKMFRVSVKLMEITDTRDAHYGHMFNIRDKNDIYNVYHGEGLIILLYDFHNADVLA